MGFVWLAWIGLVGSIGLLMWVLTRQKTLRAPYLFAALVLIAGLRLIPIAASPTEFFVAHPRLALLPFDLSWLLGPFFTFALPKSRENGLGGWNFTQLANVYRKLMRPFSDVFSTDGRYDLDNTFPYKGSWPANGVEIDDCKDKPGNGLPIGTWSFEMNDEYWMFNAYMPPSVGNPVEWVPLKRLAWFWKAKGNEEQSGWTWPIIGGTNMESEEEFPTWRFQWDNVVSNRG